MADRADAGASYTMEALLACTLVAAALALTPLLGPQHPSAAAQEREALAGAGQDALTALAHLPDSELAPPLSHALRNATEFQAHRQQVEACLRGLLSPEVGFRFSCPWGAVSSGEPRPGARVPWLFLDADAGVPMEAALEVWYA